MGRFETSWSEESLYFIELLDVLVSLMELEKDELLELNINKIKVTDKRRSYGRHVCLPFDFRFSLH
ncbi:MAG: oxygen-independent coproporphyrinogen-3 oxidase [Nonlabens sp.]|jgi:oxygen-independent coproporphyrinogen-3 oxidase